MEEEWHARLPIKKTFILENDPDKNYFSMKENLPGM